MIDVYGASHEDILDHLHKLLLHHGKTYQFGDRHRNYGTDISIDEYITDKEGVLREFVEFWHSNAHLRLKAALTHEDGEARSKTKGIGSGGNKVGPKRKK